MDKSTDKPKRTFQCPECGEHLTTRQNLKRHCLRKHKETVWESVVESPPITVNELIETDPLISIILDDRGIDSPIGGLSPQTGKPETQAEPIPSDIYLIHLRKEYEKYQHLYKGIDNRMKWDEYNSKVDINLCKHTFSVNMYRILTDIRDAKLPIN
jgi:hypothetical protein